MTPQADETKQGTKQDSAGRGASLLPEHYTDAEQPQVLISATAPEAGTEAIVTVEPSIAAPATVPSGSRARSLANLRPYKKGESGNRNGRPKGIVSKALTKELKRKMADSGETVVQALVKRYTAKALEELDPARFNSIRDTVDGKPVSQDDGAGVGVGLLVQLEVVGRDYGQPINPQPVLEYIGTESSSRVIEVAPSPPADAVKSYNVKEYCEQQRMLRARPGICPAPQPRRQRAD